MSWYIKIYVTYIYYNAIHYTHPHRSIRKPFHMQDPLPVIIPMVAPKQLAQPHPFLAPATQFPQSDPTKWIEHQSQPGLPTPELESLSISLVLPPNTYTTDAVLTLFLPPPELSHNNSHLTRYIACDFNSRGTLLPLDVSKTWCFILRQLWSNKLSLRWGQESEEEDIQGFHVLTVHPNPKIHSLCLWYWFIFNQNANSQILLCNINILRIFPHQNNIIQTC